MEYGRNMAACQESTPFSSDESQMPGRHRSAPLWREIVRGRTGSGYRARVGEDVTDANLKRPKPRRLDDNPALLAEVLRGLRLRHSPEQIAG
jgi:transposase, IS30 family